MKDIIKQVNDNIQKYNLLNAGDKVLLGVSGGPDSIMLLLALNELKEKLKIDIVVAHVNHMIRKEAIQDEILVRKTCDLMNIECHVLKADVLNEAKTLKISTEECGRNIRYEFFAKIVKDFGLNKIAVAHNLGDNAETILMNMIRGTGLSGICGMEYCNNNIIRPLLNVDKRDILEYLNSKQIEYAIDRTNMENDYTRNNIRNRIIPLLEEINPNFLNGIYRMAEGLKQDKKVIEDLVCKETEMVTLKKTNMEIILDIKAFETKPAEIKQRMIRYLLNELLGSLQGIEKIHVEDICTLISKKITGKKFILGNKFTVEILRGKKAKICKN
ncbi:MAG: tRNA lysidine(34) synthetase TilS [Clostridia bacterium]|nr:tRNA lysidine(34) synthetase TilS [Clostridia bacterium]